MKALIVIDMQNDFLPSGALPVPEGDKIIPGINSLITRFHEQFLPVILTQDWHPPGHLSFASSHPNKKPGVPIEEEGLGPILWPDHCVQGTKGAEFASGLETYKATLILRKGFRKNIDSYSAFYENDKKTVTGLTGYLKSIGVTDVYICGLATDYCCYFSAVDAKKDGFNVFFIEDLTKGIDQPKGSLEGALEDMKKKGIKIIMSESIDSL